MALFQFSPDEYIKLMRTAIGTAFLIVHTDYDELESVLNVCNISIEKDDEEV
jgi:hypothetical protein